MDLYLNAAECQPTECLSLEFRGILDVVQDDMLDPPVILIFHPSRSLDFTKSKELLRAHPGQMQIDSQRWILGISEFGENFIYLKTPCPSNWIGYYKWENQAHFCHLAIHSGS